MREGRGGGDAGATALTYSFSFTPTPNPSPQGGGELQIAGVSLVADISGALFWDEQSLLVVSDLHLEKGSSFAARGVLLPPYDTVATLEPARRRDRAARSAHGDRARRQLSRS